jgi:hypothetical protein
MSLKIDSAIASAQPPFIDSILSLSQASAHRILALMPSRVVAGVLQICSSN